jgi:predicted LPLAT superfamily acyltransferase
MRYDRSEGHTMEQILGAFSRSLEQMVRRYPEQWFNYYSFWS